MVNNRKSDIFRTQGKRLTREVDVITLYEFLSKHKGVKSVSEVRVFIVEHKILVNKRIVTEMHKLLERGDLIEIDRDFAFVIGED